MYSLPVHQRLHNQGLSAIRNKNEADKLACNKLYKTPDEMISWKFQSKPSSITIGERLYNRALKQMEGKRRKEKMAKQEIERKEVKELKSVPRIRKDAHSEYLLRKQNYAFDIDKLVNEGKERTERIKYKKAEDFLKEQDMNRHQPIINKNSSKMVSEMQTNANITHGREPDADIDRFKALYCDAEKRQNRIKNTYSKFLPSD